MGTNVQDVAARAKELISQRKYRDAVRACRRVLLSRPDEAAVRLLLAQALLALNRHDEVRIEMQALTRKDPRCVSAYRLLAEAHIRGGNKDAALDALHAALQLAPDDTEARELLEELDELDGPPPMETIERWFGNLEPATVEMQGGPLDMSPTRMELPPTATVRTDPGFVAASEQPTKPQVRRHKRTMLGMPAVVPAPAAPEPSRSFDAEATTAGRKTRGRPLSDGGTESLDSFELVDETAEEPRSSSTRELSVEDLAFEEFETDAAPLQGEATHAVGASPPLPNAEPPRPDGTPGPFEDPREPLEGEETQARPQRPSAKPNPDADEWTARPRRPNAPAAPPPAAPPPAAPGWPEATPLAGEPTLARSPAAPAPAARPRAGGAALTPAAPATVEANASSASTAAEATPVVASAPKHERSRSARVSAWAARLGPLRGLRGPALVAVAGVPVLLLVALVAGTRLYLASRAEERIAEAAHRASMSGTLADLRAALALDAEEDAQAPGPIARRARLRAVVLLDHGLPDAAAAQQEAMRIRALLQSLPAGERATLVDALAAQIFLSLREGRPDQAVTYAERVPPTDRAEGAYAAARAALNVGDAAAAEQAAGRLAPELRVGPRYGALVARVLVAKGALDSALAALDRVVDAQPLALLARAEVHRARGDAEAMFADAQRVFEQLGDESPRLKAWAQLLLAEARLLGGEMVAARDLATGLDPLPGDEEFGLRLAELLRRVGATERALTVLGALPEVAAQPSRRALVQAEVFLAHGDLERAEAALASAEPSGQTSYLRGRLAQAKGLREEAVAHYEAATADPAQFVRAQAALGAMALQAGALDEAIEHLRAAQERAPADPEVVSTLVQAQLAKGAVEDARATVDQGLARHPTAPALRFAKARVELARGQPAAALAILDELAARRPDDAEVHAWRGEAARRVGDAAKAQEAFGRALELSPRHPLALVGRVELALAAYDLEAANAALAAAREGELGRHTLAVLEGRLLLRQGAGKEAATTLRRAVRPRRRRFSRDPAAWAAYGAALAQAEDDRAAIRALERALRLDEGQVDAHLALAAVRTRRGDLGGAARAIGEARRLVESQALGPMYEARVLAATGRLRYESGSLREADELAAQALEKDPQSAPAHLLRALVKDAEGQNPVPHLRRALEGHFPTPEILGQLVLFDRRADDRCALARRYLDAAPRGLDAREARSVLRRCR